MLSFAMGDKIVIDTSVFVSAVLSTDGAARAVLRLALNREVTPVFGNALFNEYQDVLGRDSIFEKAAIGRLDRQTLFEAVLHVGLWTNIHFLWRPNLPDENDNHVLELGIASGARAIVTHNVKDFNRSELLFPNLTIATPSNWLERRQPT
jgi:putative PIN family toxin of toxin-antitoxin system